MLASHPKPGRVLLAVLLATLAIFGGLVLGITLKLRERLREQVLRREAEAIHAVAVMQLHGGRERFAAFEGEDGTESLFAAVLHSSRLRGVMAVQLFDPKGELREAIPPAIEESVGPHWWAAELNHPEARFIQRGSLDLISPLLVTRKTRNVRVPLLDIAVPLRVEEPSASPLGVARYWIDGAQVAAEFAAIDRSLALPSGIAFLGGSILVGLVVAWASSRLAEANRQLVEQSADLLRANQELDFAAKTGALGAISAHLIHGLKNPLAGIEGFVTETAAGGTEAVGGDACRAAVETTRRLRLLVNEVIAVLRDETEGGGDYGVPVAEVIEAARRRAVPLAEQTGVVLSATAEPAVEITGRAANLAGLVLSNLLANAIEALPRRGQVSLEARRVEAGAEFLVSDSGPGLPPAVKEALFRPVRSGKRGGSGMGLAISHRLAKHAGGDLQLVRTGQQGTTFRLIVPTVEMTVNAV